MDTKLIMICLLISGVVVLADTVKLKGVDTLNEMRIKLHTSSSSYLNQSYAQSKIDTETILDLYWALECSTELINLNGFAHQHAEDQQLLKLKKLHHESRNESIALYKNEMTTIHQSHCDKVEEVVSIR